MANATESQQPSAPVGVLVDMIRPEVRAEKAYHVGLLSGAVAKLDQNENPFDLPTEFKARLLRIISGISLNRYPLEQPERLKQAIAAYLGCDDDQILVGNGSNELTHTLGLCLLTPGTKVVLPTPMFALYKSVARLFGAETTHVPCLPDLTFDVDGLVRAARDTESPLVIVATPNNPTARALSTSDLRLVADACHGFLVVDEAYAEFNREPSAIELMPDYPNIIVLRTFSKAWGLAGVRVGYMVGHAAVIREFLKARLPFMVDPIAEAIAVELLNEPEIMSARVRSIERQREHLIARMSRLEGLTVYPSTANFVLFGTKDATVDLKAPLKSKGIAVRDMSGYEELVGILRVSVGTEKENQAFLAALEASLSGKTVEVAPSRDDPAVDN